MPYFTDEQRKNSLWHTCGRFIFQCEHCDLSAPVRVSPLLEYKKCSDYPASDLVSATASFAVWWDLAIRENLNGFPGMDTIKWEIN